MSCKDKNVMLNQSFLSQFLGQSPKLFYFNAVKEGQSADFAAENENERTGWITALVRATGQSYRPEPPTRVKSQQIKSSDSAKFTQFINASVETIDHHVMFRKLQSLTLNYRLSDTYCSLVRELFNHRFCSRVFESGLFSGG